MAMPATHLRFAATLADPLGVKDLSAFLSGTLYPDSRWTTGIEREVTHAVKCLEPDFPSDDFTLGWHLHCLCDQYQLDLLGRFLDPVTGLSPDERWIQVSAIKVVQDMNDAVRSNLDTLLPLLSCPRAPNGESCNEVELYFQAVQRAYGGRMSPGWNDYAQLWMEIELAPERILQIEAQVNRLLENETRATEIRELFDRLINRFEKNTAGRGGNP